MAGTALAADPVFDPLYMVVGSVDRNGAPGAVDGRQVVFYQSYPTVVRATIGPTLNPSGRYALNIFDNGDIRMESSNIYYVAVERASDNWGARPVAIQLSPEGWARVDLRLEEGVGPGISTEAPDDGMINNTRIERMTDGRLKILWSYNDPGVTQADLFRYIPAAPEMQFSVDTSQYLPINSSPVSGTEFIDDPADIRVADGKCAYYRVVPAGVPPANIFGTDPASGRAYNKRTAGKTDIRLGEEYNSLSYPFNSAYISVTDLMGGQLSEGDQIHWWDGGAQTYRIITRLGSGWPAGHNFEFGDGYFIYIVPSETSTPRSVNLTLVGVVDNFLPGITKPLGAGYSLLGYNYPVVRNGSTAGFAAREGEIGRAHV
jgi:hypothetical protein